MTDAPIVPEVLTREEWLRQRGTFCGASELASILNLPGAYGNIGDVWLSKRQALQQIEMNDAEAVDPETAAKFDRKSMGSLAEPLILTLYEMENPGYKVRRNGLRIWRHPEYPFIAATTDAEATTEFDDLRTVEAKNVTVFKRQEWGIEGSDQVPAIFAAQGIQQMLVREHLGYGTFCDFAVWFGGNDFKVFPVPYDREQTANIIELLGWFWGLVQRGEAPPIDLSWKNAPRLYRKIYDQIIGDTKVLTGPEAIHAAALVAARDYAHEQGKRWSGEKGDGGIKGKCTAELLAIAENYGRVEIHIPGAKNSLELVRSQRAGHEVAAYHVDPFVVLNYKPYQLKARDKFFAELGEEHATQIWKEQQKQIGGNVEAGE